MPSSSSVLVASVIFGAAFVAANEAAAQAPRAGDAERGRTLFQQSCAVCHATGLPGQTPAGQGPSLAGVAGRTAATLPGFPFSTALTASKLTWDVATLHRYLEAPATAVPGTNMVVAVPNATDRGDIIAFLGTLRPAAAPVAAAPAAPRVAGAGDYQNDAPGNLHRVKVAELPKPGMTPSAQNQPRVVDRPAGANLSVPPGFQVKQFASGLNGPRLMRTAPNGDIFIAETRAGQVRVLRAPDGADAPVENSVFATGLRGPFGISFYPQTGEPQWVYVANLNSVVRFPYRSGDLKASGPAETLVDKLSDTTGGHSTRDVVFSADGKRMFISVGSGSNVAEGGPKKTPEEIRAWESAEARGAAWGPETHRANVLVADPDGKNLKIYATGIRNAVGLLVHPATGAVWVSVNERDGLGDDLVPDYISSIKEGGYYGWPWYYMGKNEDPRHAGARPDLAGVAIVPDVPLQAHSASLQITSYPTNVSGAAAFPAEYRGEIFGALHGSWNRAGRTGSKVVRVKLKNGVATGEYEDFLTGFVVNDGSVWGRPVGVTVAHDGALIVSDDAKNTLWRISYSGK